MIDLGDVTQFDEIVVYNRVDLCPERSRTLQILMSSDGEKWERIHVQGNVIFGGIDGNPLRVQRPRTYARFVKLQLDSTDYLHFDEVQILQYAADNAAHGQSATVT